MIQKIQYQVKDGPYIAIYLKVIDTSKPKIKVVGNFYEFNSEVYFVEKVVR